MTTRILGSAIWDGLDALAARSLKRTIERGGEAYDRRRHLPQLIPIGPDELEDSRPEMRRAILAKLARALRAERNRGRAGHWTYDLNRHIGLRQAYLAEKRFASASTRAPQRKKPPLAGDGFALD